MDKGWTVEIAIHGRVNTEARNGNNVPEERFFEDFNFSRVNWHFDLTLKGGKFPEKG